MANRTEHLIEFPFAVVAIHHIVPEVREPVARNSMCARYGANAGACVSLGFAIEGIPLAYRRNRSPFTLSVKAAELAFAAPQVVAHRLTRMALSGPQLSARDRREFDGMWKEKNVAFGASWNAMARQTAVAQQALAGSFFKSMMTLATGGRPSVAKSAAQMQKSMLDIFDKGLAPVHRKAVANAKRLSKTKLR